MSELGQQANQAYCGPQREKYWSELTLEQKVERMRNEVRRLQQIVDNLYRTDSAMTTHQHGQDGSVLVRFGGTCGPGPMMLHESKGNSDDVYF